MNIRLYQEGDYEAIQDCVEPFGKAGCFDDIRDRGLYLTVTENEIPVGCGGIIYDRDDEGVIWLSLSDTICSKPITLVRILKKGFEILKESFQLNRITAKVNENFEAGKRFVRFFGFKPTEETMKIFTNTYRIYEI